MDISSQRREGILVVSPKGRLDAQGAMDLEDFLRDHIKDTDRTAVLDMAGVVYLSSAGIRTIMVAEKKMRARKGRIHLSSLQPYPLSVLEMTGFVTVFSIHRTGDDAVSAARSTVAPEDATGERDAISFHRNGAEYLVTRTGPVMPVLEITGYPIDDTRDSRDEECAVPITVSPDTCSMGWGAPGRQTGQSAGLMGDLLTIGNIAAWLSPDCHDTLDYLIIDPKKPGIPVTADFLIHPSGPAHYVVHMKSDSPAGIMLSDLFDALFGIAGRMEPAYKGVLFLSFCAESPEVSLRFPGPGDQDAATGEKFQAQIVDSPSSATLAGCAVAVDPAVQPAHFKGAVADVLFHRFPHHPGVVPRVMSMIFRDLPLDEEKTPHETIEKGLSSGIPVILRHLSTSTRIHRATMQISVISDIILNTGTEIVIEKDIPGWNPDYEKIVRMVHHDCSEVRLFPISGGYSGSLVFRDDAYDRRGRREMPFVLKLDSWENISAEIEGYEGHVKRYIQNNATQIIQHERSGDYGGILYTFVGINGPQSRIFSLEDFYLSHSPQEVLAVFDILFRKVLGAWYGQPRLRYLPLYQVYANIFNYQAVAEWAESRYGISSRDEYIDLPHGMGRSINPLYFIEHIVPERLTSDWNVYEGSVHGDLNMKNVLMDEEKNMWLIDFAMTGHSHILRDVAKLESVLKMEMIPISSEIRLLRLLELEKIFLRQETLGDIPEIPEGINDPDIIKAFAVVRKLRRYADTLTLLDEDIRQYNLALLHYTLCVPAYVSVNDFMKEYAWISSSLLCKTLM
ncbi:MAG TPA: anti-sigma factor antagonist [Methanoregulaceae archaeon]|nr:anti-sigma factor antagonist [Methanoregulaceae archaeon]